MSSYETVMIVLTLLTFVVTLLSLIVKLLLVIINSKKENNEKK